MRILVHEFASGGGLAGQDAPASLAREGAAMLAALLEDLAALRRHRIVTTADARFPLVPPSGVEVTTLSPVARGRAAQMAALLASVDAAWFVAPETGGHLARLAAQAERRGVRLLGSSSAAIRAASDKAGLARRLTRGGVPCPMTRVLGPAAAWTEWKRAARAIGYPVVVKPRRGAGCEGVGLARNDRELGSSIDRAAAVDGRGALLLQRFVRGAPASVSLLAAGRRTVALTVNAQSVRAAGAFRYSGGVTPLDHPLAGQAVEAARRACAALPDLHGYIGVDLVLTDAEAVVIEVNPRLTTAYLGVRAALEGNVAALALRACAGALPRSVAARRRVRFTAGGRIVSATPLAA